MPTRDNHSDQLVFESQAEIAIGSNTTTNGVIFDLADFDMGAKFAHNITAYTDGTFTISYEDGDDAALADAAAVPAEQVIGDALALTAATVGSYPSNGVFSTKRYVRQVITSTGVTTGATINSVIVKRGEYNPQD